MNAELYYLIGKSGDNKQALISALRQSLSGQSDILVPEIYTTDVAIADEENYVYIDERNFNLRQSMDLYGLNWEKNGHFYGVNGDISQRLNSGTDVILNGSIHNVEQARHRYPNINTLLIKKEGNKVVESDRYYLIAENDEVRMEWDSQDAKLGHPYVLTLMSEHGMENALEMILSFIEYNRNCLEYAG